MRTFTFPLESLLKYRRNRRDLCRQFLAATLRDDRALQKQQQQLQQQRDEQLHELGRLGHRGEVDIHRSAALRHHAAYLQSEAQLVERNRQLLALQLETCRQTLLQAVRDVKVLERLKERRRAEFLNQQQYREARELEDAWNAAQAMMRRA